MRARSLGFLTLFLLLVLASCTSDNADDPSDDEEASAPSVSGVVVPTTDANSPVQARVSVDRDVYAAATGGIETTTNSQTKSGDRSNTEPASPPTSRTVAAQPVVAQPTPAAKAGTTAPTSAKPRAVPATTAPPEAASRTTTKPAAAKPTATVKRTTTTAPAAAATTKPTPKAEPKPSSKLATASSWQWQLQGNINTSYDADLYEIDLFDPPRATINKLHTADRIVICYFSAGSVEDWRSDANKFPADQIGKPLSGWPGERWVDIRGADVRKIMLSRLDLAKSKGCDGVTPDNVTAYNDDSGFNLTASDQLAYNRFLARAARQRGLMVGLKNDIEQIPALVADFDFAINEQCFEYNECDSYKPFLNADKPVFNAEYASRFVNDQAGLCRKARALGLRTIIVDVDLDDSLRIACNS